MKFVDNALISVISGNGGRGAISFRREKFIPKGGPDGGNGGKGGDVIFIPSHNVTSLLDFKFKPRYAAENGGNGQGNNKTGKDGKDIVLKVPVGTMIFDYDSNEIIADLKKDGEQFIVLQGGRGGRGNTFFKSSVNRRPRFSQPGIEGQTKKIRLILKSIGDIGIVGLPNAGKSTLISKLSRSHPEIAPYPFTTKVPNLGICYDDTSNKIYTLVDIPGIINGAAEGTGLGLIFLKHIERSNILLHLIEIGNVDEVKNKYETVINEIDKFNKEILKKKQIVVINKIDLIPELKEFNKIKGKIIKFFKDKDIAPHFISASNNIYIEELKESLSKLID